MGLAGFLATLLRRLGRALRSQPAPQIHKVSGVGIVRFADYRQYEQVRVEASNAVMGLLAGARMAAHMLQLTEGSDRLLPEIFPQIPHIGRLNLTTEAARDILIDGDVYLGAMAVPYALAIHEDYLKTCLTLLQRGGIRLTKPPGDLKLANQHEEIERGRRRTARGPAPRRTGTAAGGALAACAAVGVAVIATVMASRDVTA